MANQDIPWTEEDALNFSKWARQHHFFVDRITEDMQGYTFTGRIRGDYVVNGVSASQLIDDFDKQRVSLRKEH